jgi:hypothetical protein
MFSAMGENEAVIMAQVEDSERFTASNTGRKRNTDGTTCYSDRHELQPA